MLLPMDTWSAACCWFSTCTNCSIVRPDSASCCSIQVSGKAKAELWPCSRRANSATKGARQGRIRARHVGDHQDQILRILLDHRHHPIGPAIGQVLVGPVGGDEDRDTAEILDQRQAQHDRDGPQFAQPQGGDRLIGRDETVEVLGVDPTIAVGDDLQGKVIDARQSGGWSLEQARQLPAVALGEMSLGGADLIFDQIKIVEQPFAGRRDPTVLRDGGHEQSADADQDGFILGQASEQAVRRMSGHQGMRIGQALAVLFHLHGTEELRAQRRLVADRRFDRTLTGKPSPELNAGCRESPNDPPSNVRSPTRRRHPLRTKVMLDGLVHPTGQSGGRARAKSTEPGGRWTALRLSTLRLRFMQRDGRTIYL